MNKYFRLPLKWSTIETYFSSSHMGIDFAWNSSKGGPNVPVYASTDGVVTMAEFWGDAGNTIRIRYDDPNKKYSVFTQYKHLSKMGVKVGSKVKMGQQIGNMGNTGSASTGAHLHFDFVKTPYQYNYQQSSSDRKKYSLNPSDYCFLFEGQTHGESNKGLMSLLGTSKSVKRDTAKNQIEVFGYKLRVRKGAGTNQTVLGYCDYGIYNYTETKSANGYNWYNVGFGWIAGTKEDTKVYLKEEPKPTPEPEPTPQPADDKDKKIVELEEKVKLLDSEISAQKTVIEKQKQEIDKLTEEIENLQNSKEFASNLTMFTANKEGYWKIYLKKDEKVYY